MFRFIVLEGIDGTGKTSVAKEAKVIADSNGIPFISMSLRFKVMPQALIL